MRLKNHSTDNASPAKRTTRGDQPVVWLTEAYRNSLLLPWLVFSALILALPHCRSYFGPEIQAILAARGGMGDTLRAVASDVHPPLYFFLLKAVRAVGGERELALRLLSMAFAIAAFPFLWAIARRFFGRSVGVAAWLLATSSFVVFDARFLRYYSLGLLETAAATYLLLLLLERQKREEEMDHLPTLQKLYAQTTRKLQVAYGVVLALSVYTFYLSAILIVSHAIVLIVAWRDEPRRFVPPLIVAIGVGVVFFPWVSVLSGQLATVSQVGTAAPLNARATSACAQMAYTFYAFVASDSISPFALPFSAAVAVFYAILTVLGVRKVLSAPTTRSLVLLTMVGLGLAVPALLRLAGWLPGPFIYMPMRLLFVAPFFILIVACGIISIGDPRVRRAAFAAAIAIQAISLFNYYTGRQWTNWALVVPMDELIAHIELNEEPGDVVVLDEWNLYDGPFYYWNGIAAVYRFGWRDSGKPPRLSEAPRIWVVRAVRDNDGRMDRLLLPIKQNFILKERKDYVREPVEILHQKRRRLRREVSSHKIECLLFEHPSARRDVPTSAPLSMQGG